MKVFWTENQLALLREHYPNMPMPELTKLLNKSVSAIYGKVYALGIKRSQEFLDSPAACKLRRGDEIGKSYRFKKGQVPPNKGMKGVYYEGSAATFFAKGHEPANYKPIGAIRTSCDGYYEIKIADGMHQWRFLHRVIWERCNGAIPKSYIVSFIDRNPQNINIKNMSLFTKAQNMQRNTLHRYPKEIATLIQLQGAINRQINKRAENEQHRNA